MHLTSRGVIEDTLVNLERTAEATDRTGDHAGFVETSLMMALLPDHVDLERIRHRHPDNLYDDPLEGISESERPVVTATVEDGRALLEAITTELASICREMLAKQGGRPTRVNYVGCT